jgi:transglutaminase-like putative cysteine protease
MRGELSTSKQRHLAVVPPAFDRVCVNRADALLSSAVLDVTLKRPQDDADLRLFLSPAEYIDSDHPRVRAAAAELAGSAADPVERARLLYRAVRDQIRYDPYVDFTDKETYRASSVLERGHAYCVGKAALYAALCRASGIPARLGLADVKNHLATPRLLEAVGTDLFAYHGFVELMPRDVWIKATPTFNLSLCQKLGVPPLEFTGEADALLQPFDAGGRAFMSYVTQHGSFFDVPAKFLMLEMARLYPKLCRPGGLRGPAMEEEAALAERAPRP